MQFALSEEHTLIRDSARRVAREVIAPRAAEVDRTAQYPEDYFQALKAADLLGITLPREVGGADAGTLAMGLAIEEVAKYDCSAGLMIMLGALATHTIKFFGTPDQVERFVGPVARGEKKAAFCLTEPDAGSDVAGLQARAERDGDEWVITAQKQYISGGPVADQVIVFAKTEPGNPRSTAAFVVDTKTPGFEVTSVDRKMGVRGLPTGVLTFDRVRVPHDQMVGGEPIGMRGPLATLNSLRPCVGARGVGLAEGATEYALNYARERRAFGGPLTDLQAIQFKLANMAIEIEAARLLVYQGCWLVEQGKYGPNDGHMLSVAKAFATEMANRVASEAIQILGGQGYMEDHPLERHYRDARQLMIVEGTSEIQRTIIAKALIDRNLSYA
ncbi:MAG: acyl-CoA dehydrogenase family protein [Dehalococcoidia bacterium]|nr:acyl-CoA dehydrogenase family protein [Dehalococcoidia bacterium]MCB9491123.1 acyl-CoA dehydrogenase family protein [Dehalococcoidia bacterium]